MQILFINNDGAGFADQIDIAEGTTVDQLFAQKIPHGNPDSYLIRVNRQPTLSQYVLQPGDRVSITPTKIEGAQPATNPNTKGPSWEPDNGSTQSIYLPHWHFPPSSAR